MTAIRLTNPVDALRFLDAGIGNFDVRAAKPDFGAEPILGMRLPGCGIPGTLLVAVSPTGFVEEDCGAGLSVAPILATVLAGLLPSVLGFMTGLTLIPKVAGGLAGF